MYGAFPAHEDSSKVIRLTDLLFEASGKFTPEIVAIGERTLGRIFPDYNSPEGGALHVSERRVELYDGTERNIDNPMTIIHEDIKQNVSIERSSSVSAYRRNRPDCTFHYESNYYLPFDILHLLIRTSHFGNF